MDRRNRSARVHHESPTPVQLQHIGNFCSGFNPEHARLAPDRSKSLCCRVLGFD